MRVSRTPAYAAWTLLAAGLLLTFGPLLRVLAVGLLRTDIHMHSQNIRWASIVSLPVVGILLIYLAIFVYHRRFYAAYSSVVLLVLTTLYIIIFYPNSLITYSIGSLALLYAVLLIMGRKRFTIKNNSENLSHYLKRVGVIVIIGFLYGTVGFYLLSSRYFYAHFSILESIGMSLTSLTGLNGTIAEPTRLGQVFIDSLNGIGILILVLLLNALFRPLRITIFASGQHDYEMAKHVIETKSRSSEDYFKLWPRDKKYYFSDNQRAFITYKQTGRTVIVLGDPTGKPSAFDDLVADFFDYCRTHGWYIAAINTTKLGQEIFMKNNLSTLFIGNEGVIDIEKFMTHTIKNKHFRYVRNRAMRDQLSVEEWHDLTIDQADQLHAISNAWLQRGSRREYTFFMGYFDYEYMRQCRIFVLTENKRPVAYINLIPSFFSGHESLDHLRSRDDISPVGMHFMVMKVLGALHTERAQSLNIGLSPLSGADENAKLVSKVTLRLVGLLGASYYSFRGLEQFKNKFVPEWEPRSILYGGTTASLVRIIRDIEQASAYAGHNNKQAYIGAIVGLMVLTLGLYMILG